VETKTSAIGLFLGIAFPTSGLRAQVGHTQRVLFNLGLRYGYALKYASQLLQGKPRL